MRTYRIARIVRRKSDQRKLAGLYDALMKSETRTQKIRDRIQAHLSTEKLKVIPA